MKTVIYCKPTKKGIHSFYLINEKEEIFLFSQAYRKSVDEYYSKGVLFEDAMRYSKAHRDSAVVRTMSKLPIYLRYIEKERGIAIFNKAKKRNQKCMLRYA
ncbi:MAG: hypothetical protein E7308_10165 [Butyrivibrio sp.]|nr:hypothetical protein [Butyrivibrio sp.]